MEENRSKRKIIVSFRVTLDHFLVFFLNICIITHFIIICIKTYHVFLSNRLINFGRKILKNTDRNDKNLIFMCG